MKTWILVLCTAFACEPATKSTPEPVAVAPTAVRATGLANPASEHCVAKGGRLEIKEGEGGQFGVCIFQDDSRCEEWRFLRKECSPGTCHAESGICD